MFVTGIGDLDDFGSLSTVPATVKVTTSKKVIDKPRITVMYEFCRLFKHFVLMMLLWSWPCIKTRCRIQGCKDTAPLPRWRRITPGLSFVIYGRFLCVCVLLRCFRLSVPVQLIAWKDLSTKLPIMCRVGRWTLDEHSLTYCVRPHYTFWEISAFAWLNYSVQNLLTLFTLTFRSLTEIFIRRSWYSVLPRLDVTIDYCVKKAVMGVTELITALVLIHGSLTFLSDVHCFFDPPARLVWWRVNR